MFNQLHAGVSEATQWATENLKNAFQPLNDKMEELDSVLHPVRTLVHPPRNIYSDEEVDEEFAWSRGLRKEITLPSRGSWLRGTVIQVRPDAPTVLYCHGHGSCRMSGMCLAEHLFRMGLNYIGVDWPSQGQSEGTCCTMGAKESEDLYNIVEHLQRHGGLRQYAVYGRSMGAATALLAARSLPGMTSLVADSPFSNLSALLNEKCPGASTLLASPVKREANFDIVSVSPQTVVGGITKPAIFMVGDADSFVPPWHTESLQRGYLGPSVLHKFPGDHCGERPQKTLDLVSNFFASTFAPLTLTAVPSDPHQALLQASANEAMRQQSVSVEEVDARGRSLILMVCSRRERSRGIDHMVRCAFHQGLWHEIPKCIKMPTGGTRIGTGNRFKRALDGLSPNSASCKFPRLS